MKKILTAILVLFTFATAFADEGMWIPMLLGKNEADMQKQGMRITAKDIYDINNACLKDAVVLFGGGCTGEYVSSQGLLFTNHHCGYSQIAARSTLEHNYLANGFWAKSFDEEIPCPGLTVTRLVRMEDVTNQALANVKDDMSEADRNAIINENIKNITDKAVEGTHYKAIIKPFYYGNQYFMYVNEVFTDVRLVGTPPSNIGKFGGDTDNWMWPRHTGDFSVFRVYAKDNKPAPYSAENKPYKPLKHLTISLKGAEQNDFTFVFGYPGTTQRYITSDAVELIANQTNPVRIALRTIRLDHYNNAMNQDAAQRLKYSSTVASIANGWKKWQGETLGVNRLEVPKMKREFEQKFQQWANDKAEYRDVLPQLAKTYSTLKPIELERTYFNEAVMASDFMKRAYAMWQLAQKLTDDEALKTQCESLVKSNEKYFADFEKHTIVDKAIFIETFTYMWQKGYAKSLDKKCGSKADVEEFLDKIYEKSMLTHKDKVIDFLKGYTTNKRSKLLKDPAVALFTLSYNAVYNKDKNDTYRTANQDISRLMRTYVKGMMEMQPDVNFFPDANLTLRVAYGHVDGFRPKDGVSYKPYTTIEGIMQKENPDIYDYVVEPRLKELYNNKDFGQYANAKGELPVCFIATNHTTGGNSGSPVINADGQLIGLNFDRCWEGTMSDILFDPEYCRNITLDIRYCLFIIDKFAGATNLISELDIVK